MNANDNQKVRWIVFLVIGILTDLWGIHTNETTGLAGFYCFGVGDDASKFVKRDMPL